MDIGEGAIFYFYSETSTYPSIYQALLEKLELLAGAELALIDYTHVDEKRGTQHNSLLAYSWDLVGLKGVLIRVNYNAEVTGNIWIRAISLEQRKAGWLVRTQ